MNGRSEITLHLPNINELLRSPVSLYRKRTLKTDTEEFNVDEAKGLPRKAAINMKAHLALSKIRYKDDIVPAYRRHFCYRRDQPQKNINAFLSMSGEYFSLHRMIQ